MCLEEHLVCGTDGILKLFSIHTESMESEREKDCIYMANLYNLEKRLVTLL